MKKLYIFIITLAFFLGSYVNSFGQNNLLPGDIAFTSYQADQDATNATTNFDDRFSITVLRSGGIAANAVLFFTDYGWNTSTNDFVGPGVEGYIKWVVPAGGIAQGTEVYFISTYNDALDLTTWNAYTTETGTTILGTTTTEGVNGPIELAVSGDQILVFQTGAPAGPASTYDNTTRRFITAIHANIIDGVTNYLNWDGTNPSTLNSSNVPPGLTNGTTAFLMSPGPLPGVSNGTTEPDNGKFNCNAGGNCTALDFSTNIYTITNWTYSNTAFAAGATVSHCAFSPSALAVIGTQPSPSTVCSGVATTFTSSATGAASYQWQESTTSGFVAPVTLTNTGVYSGATTTTLSISNTNGLNGRYYRMVALNSCSVGTNSNGALLTATQATLPGSGITTSHTANSSDYYYGASCAIVSKIIPSGASPVSGSTSTRVWIEPGVPLSYGRPYVQRHYEINPVTNATTATGTVTLYFSQAEFTAFNAAPGSTLDLPTGAADAVGKSNLRIGKYSGTSSNGTGLPGSYNTANSVIDPLDANIVWNATTSQWEVTFDAVGFGGYIIQTSLQVLPINLMSFTAQPVSNDITLKWQTATEINNDHIELERSTDGATFIKVASVTGSNTSSVKTYEWVDVGAGLINTGKLYYRLKIVSVTGAIEYSNVILISSAHPSVEIVTNISPNPFKEKLSLNLHMPRDGQLSIKVADITGRVFLREKINASKGYSTQDINGVSRLLPGIYFLSAEFEGQKFTYKIVK